MDPLFDHEKLNVYCVELGFIVFAPGKKCLCVVATLTRLIDRFDPNNLAS
jgi:hypothetical protein